jgi:predicted acylesterase/phospholipase RssA
MQTFLLCSRHLGLSLLVFAAGCSGLPRDPVPETMAQDAVISGIENARFWADQVPPYAEAWLAQSEDSIRERYPASFGKPHNYLAISGGGANGAFAAGLLNGWTEAGNRPVFTTVTGTSTGALIAPFAFLGSKYDSVLKQIYTQYDTKDLIDLGGRLSALMGEAMGDPTPLQERIAEFVDEEIMMAIAAEFRTGRMLLISTTNLDVGRAVTWNIGQIADSGAPGALDLIRSVMLASASIPVAFPPVMIKVQAGGEERDEMHVDGGVVSFVNFYPLDLDWRAILDRLQVEGRPNLFVIRNGFLDKEHEVVNRRSVAIARRSIGVLMMNVVKGDLYRLYLAAQRDGLNYQLASIPESFDLQPKEAFDKEYMTALFNLGYEQARAGYQWQRVPPNYKETHAQ